MKEVVKYASNFPVNTTTCIYFAYTLHLIDPSGLTLTLNFIKLHHNPSNMMIIITIPQLD